MILTASPVLRLEAVLAGAVATNQPDVNVDYRDYNTENEPTAPAPFRVALNSTTDVIILAAPISTQIREVLCVSIYNRDTASVTVTVKTDDGTTERPILRKTLATLESLHWSRNTGWYVLNA